MTSTTYPRRAAKAATLCALAAMALLLLPGRAAAQWTTSGSVTSTPNSVGIGTTNPQYAKLQINKSVRIDDDSGSPVGSDTMGAAPNLYIGTTSGGSVFQYNAAGGLDLWQYNSPAWARTLTFTKSGNLGIGTNNPRGQLQIGGYTTFNNLTAPTYSQFINNAHYADGWKYMNSDVASLFQIKDSLVFFNAPSGGAGAGLTWTERFRIDAAGNVGIGTSTPAAQLSVSDAGAWQSSNIGAAYFTASNTVGAGLNLHSTATGGRNFLLLSTGSGASPGGGTFGIFDATLGGAAGYRFVLNSAGNVGIGLLAPAHKLDVAGNVNAAGICIDGICKTDWSQVGGGTGGTSQWTTTGSNIYFNTGNVGIGTSTPASKLYVGGGATAVQALPGLNVALGGNSYVTASNGVATTFIGSDTSAYGIVGTLSNHPLGFRANNTLAMTVMPSGKVGIGTTAPTSSLHVVGDITATGNIAAKYQDVAEWVPSTQKLAAGTVVTLDTGKTNHVLASATAYDTKVAGVISEQPGLILGERGEGKVMVATTGRVKVRVDATSAPIQVGDLLVTSGSSGVAMKSIAVDLGGVTFHRPGTIIGKALEPLEKGTGEILVLLSLQ